MTPEEIKERIYDAIRKVAKTDEPEKFAEMNATAFEVAKKALEEISSLTTIKGWVARDMKKQALYFYTIRPTRSEHVWTCLVNSCCPIKDKKAFPDLKWEDEPIEVELPFITKKEK